MNDTFGLFVKRSYFLPFLGVLDPGGGGGGALSYRGRPHPRYVFRGKGGLYKTSACPRFCKRRVLICTQVRSMGVENPLTIHEIYAALTLSDSRSDWASETAAAKPGGGTRVQRGAAPALRISRMKGSFLKTSACQRFCKRKVLFCTQVRSMGVKIPLQSTKYTRLWCRVTPEGTGPGFRVCCRHLLLLNTQRIIKS